MSSEKAFETTPRSGGEERKDREGVREGKSLQNILYTIDCNKYPFELPLFPRNGHCGEPGNLRGGRRGLIVPSRSSPPEGIKVECTTASLTNLDNMNSAKSGGGGGGGGADKALSSSLSPSLRPSLPSAQLFDARQEPNKKEGTKERLKLGGGDFAYLGATQSMILCH